jgi:hypothetical protein
MDRRRIAELRVSLIKDAVGGDQEHKFLLTEIRPIIGHLLALADAALRIRDTYNQLHYHYGVKATMMMGDTVKFAMEELDDLEKAAKEAP